MIISSAYRPPLFLRTGHTNTIYAGLFRKVEGVSYQRERVTTPDSDFIDLDWSLAGSRNLLIALHGLEGSSERPYIKGIIKYFNDRQWDGVGMNFRGCSGEINRQLRTYHMGEISDLAHVLQHIVETRDYDQIVVAGFSLGGNVVLKYLGEKSGEVPKVVKAGIAVSVPCHLPKANVEINRNVNYLYRKRFLRSLNRKYVEKRQSYPELPPLDRPTRSFLEFDELFTAPIHGFESATEYWKQCSSNQYLDKIQVPTFLLNARDDSFLSEECFPYRQATTNDYLFLEVSDYGGHVGFVEWNSDNAYYSDRRAWQFVKDLGLS